MTHPSYAIRNRLGHETLVSWRASRPAPATPTLPELHSRPLLLRSISSPLLHIMKDRSFFDFLRTEPRKIRTREAACEDVLLHFLSSDHVAPNARELLHQAWKNQDLLFAQQMDIEGRVDGPLGRFMGNFGKGTYSCFVGRSGKDKEFFLKLKDALMANHWTSELMYKYNLVWDLRQIDREDIPIDQRIKILDINDSGEAPEFVELKGMPPIHDAQAGRTNYTRIIMRTILPRVQKEMEQLTKQRSRDENDLKRARGHTFFKNDAQGKGLACLKTVNCKSSEGLWHFDLFLRGIEDANIVHQDLINQMLRERVQGMDQVKAISIRIVANQLSLRIQSSLPKNEEARLTEQITDILDRLLIIRAVSDTHFGDYGWDYDKVERFVHFLQHAGKNGHMALFNGDVFEGWRKTWNEIAADPLYKPIWKAMRKVRKLYFNIGNHDYQIGKVEDILPELRRLTHDVKVRLEYGNSELKVLFDDLRFFHQGVEIDPDELEIIELENGELAINSSDFHSKLTVKLRQDRYFPNQVNPISDKMFRLKSMEYGERVQINDSTKFLSRGLNFDHGNKGDPYNYGSQMYDGFRWASRASTIMKFGISSEVLEDLASRFASIRNSTFRIRRKIFQYVESRRLGHGYMDWVDYFDSKESPINLSMYIDPKDRKAGLRYGLSRALNTKCGLLSNVFGHTHEDDVVPTENAMQKKAAITLGEIKEEETAEGKKETGSAMEIVQLLSWLAKPQRVYMRNGDSQKPVSSGTIPNERVTTFHAFYRGANPLITAENYYESYRIAVPRKQLLLFPI